MSEPETWPGWVDADTLRIPWGGQGEDGLCWDGYLDVTPGHPQFERWLPYAPPRPAAA